METNKESPRDVCWGWGDGGVGWKEPTSQFLQPHPSPPSTLDFK